MRAWLVGDVGDDQLDIRLMRDGTQIPHRDLIDNMTCAGGQRRSRAVRVVPDRPTDPWRHRWQRAAWIRILGALRIPPGCVSVLVALLAGCAGADPGLRVTDPPHAAAADDVDRADLTFTARDGLADHSDRYAGFAERLVHAGHAVWAFDMRGHGRSAGVRVQIDRIDDLLDDLGAFVALVRDREPDRPTVLYGHSLGGLVTALYAISRHPQVAGVVLAAPGIAFDAPPIQASAIPRSPRRAAAATWSPAPAPPTSGASPSPLSCGAATDPSLAGHATRYEPPSSIST
jgi:serine aminopeptidase S33 family